MGFASPLHLLILGLICLVFVGVPLAAVAVVIWASKPKKGPNVDICPDCGRLVSQMVQACPHCGRPLTR